MPQSLRDQRAARTAVRLTPTVLALVIAACADPNTRLTAPDPALAHSPATTTVTMSAVSVVMTGLDALGAERESTLATFPATPLPPGLPFPMPVYEAVPTEVKRGPDGALRVSTLSGAPFLPGTAAIWRLTPGAAPVQVIGGLTMVPDFDIAPDGTVWVSRYASAPFFGGPSAIDRIAPDGTRTTFLLGAVAQPTGIVVGPDGAIYISNRGSQANVGEVLRLVP